MGAGEVNFFLDAGIYQRLVWNRQDNLEFFNGDEQWKKGYWKPVESESSSVE